MQMKQNIWKYLCEIALIAIIVIVALGKILSHSENTAVLDDGIEQIDLNTIFLKDSKVEVSFSDVILSAQEETRRLIVMTQKATVSTELTDRIIKQLDFKFMKKTQKVDYTGTGSFVVDLDSLTKDSIVDDAENKVLTIKIGHAYLASIDIHPNDIIIDEVQESLLARGDIELTLNDYRSIETELRSKLEDTFNTVENGQKADEKALKMVKAVYEPAVKAVDSRYTVKVEFA